MGMAATMMIPFFPLSMKMWSAFVVIYFSSTIYNAVGLNSRSTSFHGGSIHLQPPPESSSQGSTSRCTLVMRKQKASDRRTRRRQRGGTDWQQEQELRLSFSSTVTESPMQRVGGWDRKQARAAAAMTMPPELGRTTIGPTSGIAGGRGRSRKRSTLYNSLAFYHNTFFKLLTQEYQAEEDEVLGRIKASIDNPIDLEIAGFALYDMYPQRRGNLFGDEVYRLFKAPDATTTYSRLLHDEFPSVNASSTEKQQPKSLSSKDDLRYLPPNHKFAQNDVVMITLQPQGSGDFFNPSTLPTSDGAVSVEARVLNMGPTYLDVVIPAGCFERSLGPAPNDHDKGGNTALRVRADRFLSNVPYQRMVAALSQTTSLSDRQKRSSTMEEVSSITSSAAATESAPHENIHMDEVLREAVLSTYAFADPLSPLLRDPDACDLQELSNKLAKPPMRSSHRLTAQVMKYIRNNPQLFREFNAPQQAAIEAALTRRLTLIQGPPGSGKTVVAAAIGLGFVHQCRSISPHTKPVACAFSNVGADNLAEALIRLGLKVVRVGKPSAVTEALWNHTLEAAIDRDPEAQKALKHAARATAHLSKLGNAKGKTSASASSDQAFRDAATLAVKASIQACNVAATKAIREADVVVSTSTGAADPRLLAACGIVMQETESSKASYRAKQQVTPPRENAPDGLPPLSLPFVIIDEACQSVEPASLVPIVSSDSCRALVMLGDPCQLPPTVRSVQASPFSVSLMERLAAILPQPLVNYQVDNTLKDLTFLDTLPIKQAISLVKASQSHSTPRSYRKRYAGSLLLSVQYRMHPSIAAFPSAIFYDGQLSTPNFLSEHRSFPLLNEWMPCGSPNLGVRVVDVGGSSNERQGTPTGLTRTVFRSSSLTSRGVGATIEEQTTYWNEAEAERVLDLIKELLEKDAKSPTAAKVQSIGVISPYNGQVSLIKSMIANDASLREQLLESPVTIEVRSVDGYQGRERDVIIFSAVRSNRQGRIGFLHDWRRLNVALTRAKLCLLVVGDMDTLAEADTHWAALHKWSLTSRCLVNDYDDSADEPST